jgi:hypothetical protein
MKKIKAAFSQVLLATAMFAGLIMSAASSAAIISDTSLGLSSGNPDVTAPSLAVSFNKSTDAFVIETNINTPTIGFITGNSAYGGVTNQIVNISGTVEGTAQGLLANLNFTMSGLLYGGPTTHTGTLLTGTLDAMSYVGDSVFEMIFTSTSGVLSSASEFGDTFAVNFSSASLKGFDFTGSITSVNDRADVFAQSVPSPSTFAIMLLALGIIAARRAKA